MVHFSAGQLSQDEMAGAYALVRTAAPEVGLAQWLRFSAWLAEEGGGVLAVHAAACGPVGLAAYRPDRSLRHGRMLKVELFVAFELHRSAPVRAALIEALERTGRELGCESFGIAVASRTAGDAGDRAIPAWRALGHIPDSVLLVRPLAGTSGAPAHEVALLNA